MTVTQSYPTGPVTPHGAYYLLHDRIPKVSLLAYDESVVFEMMGALSIPDRTMPERVEIKDLKGLIPPWQTIDQKGATQDGVTFIDALYDPIEVEMVVNIHGRNPAYKRRVERTLIASIDAKQTSELAWFTHELGRWWAPIRWFKTAADSMNPVDTDGNLSLRLRADSGFWQSYPNVDTFDFAYEDAVDDFDFTDSGDLGTDYDLVYSGAGDGNISANGHEAVWVEGASNLAQTVVARRVGYTSATDNQVVSTTLGSFAEWHLFDSAYNDIWARMNTSGTAGTSGVRLRFGIDWVRLSYFVGGVETVLRQRPLAVGPLIGEKWTLVAGYEGNVRKFRVLRGLHGQVPIMFVTENGTGSPVGAANRGAGFGMHAGEGVFISQASPAAVTKFSAADNSTITQSGFLERRNAGDQPFWDRYTCFGPGTFRFGNGPGSTEMVEFGPLLGNQIMQIRTDPRKRGVVDLSSTPPTPQELTTWQLALADFVNFATANNTPPLLQALESLFGIQAPQGNPYSLLSGRFSNPIPAKSPGNPIQSYYVKVEIEDGNADSQVIATGTPLRRLPW
jgi:hypothetical protein